VLSRIECFISDQVDAIARGQLPELELVSRAAGNTHMVVDEGDAGCSDDGDTGSDCSSGGEEGATSNGGSDADDESAPAAAAHEVGWAGGRAQTWTAGDASDGEEGEQPRTRPPTRRRRPRQGSQPRHAARVRLGTQTQVKSMTRSQGRQAYAVARGACRGEADQGHGGKLCHMRGLLVRLLQPCSCCLLPALSGSTHTDPTICIPRHRPPSNEAQCSACWKRSTSC
jgi:hypothetical protein